MRGVEEAPGVADGPTDAAADEPHRADYILERGIWHVTCRVCGWQDEGPVRRQLASLFRFHLRAKPPPDSPSPDAGDPLTD
jgi:hypothetical protein